MKAGRRFGDHQIQPWHFSLWRKWRHMILRPTGSFWQIPTCPTHFSKQCTAAWQFNYKREGKIDVCHFVYKLPGGTTSWTYSFLLWSVRVLAPVAGKDWKEEKRITEDEMVAWHHCPMDMSLNKLREMVRDREAWHAAVLACWGCKEWDMTERLNNRHWCVSLRIPEEIATLARIRVGLIRGEAGKVNLSCAYCMKQIRWRWTCIANLKRWSLNSQQEE